MKQPLVVINKAGGAGGEGFLDVKTSTNNPHKIIITLSNLFTTPMATGIPFNWKDLTPVAMMALDEFVLWVNAEKPYNSVKDYVDATKKAPSGSFKMGGTGSKQEDQIITVALEKAIGSKFTYIPYKGGGEVAVQLVGQHIDSTVKLDGQPGHGVQVLLTGHIGLERLDIKTLVPPLRRNAFDFLALDIADDQFGLLGSEGRDDRLADALSGASQQHDLVFQAFALRRFGHRWQGKRFSHGSRLLFEGTTKTGHLSMSGEKAVWKIAASLHLFCFFKCECVSLLGPTINPTWQLSQYIILHPIFRDLARKASTGFSGHIDANR